MGNCNLIYRNFYCKTVRDLLRYIKVRKKKRSMEYITHMRNSYIQKHICTKLWLYHNLDHEWKKIIISFLRIECYFIEKKTPLHTPSLKDANNRTKFGWNWPSSSGEGELKNFVNVLLLFRNYLPLEKGMTLCFNKLNLHPPKDAFVPSLDEIGSVSLEKRMKMWKKIKTDRWTTDNRWSEKLRWATKKSSMK